MNCKQGDLAIIVRSTCGNEGKIVHCLELFPAGFALIHPDLGPVWRVDRRISSIWSNGSVAFDDCHVPDSALRPIRGDLLDDSETSTQPREVTA